MWLPTNLVAEYESKSKHLSSDSKSLVEPVANELSELDHSGFSKAMCHLDIHRENAFAEDRSYLIIDLATTQLGYPVYDLAGFLGLFCSEPELSGEDNQTIFSKVIEEYLTVNSLCEAELDAVDLLIRATLASNILIPEYQTAVGHDPNPVQSLYYHDIGTRVLSGLTQKGAE